jgi:hypothetical protein
MQQQKQCSCPAVRRMLMFSHRRLQLLHSMHWSQSVSHIFMGLHGAYSVAGRACYFHWSSQHAAQPC